MTLHIFEGMQRIDVEIASGSDRLAAWFYPPKAGPAPCVILAHGFTAVRDLHLDAPARRFQDAGYAALVFDYRGFGDSSGQPRQVVDIAMQYDDWRAAIAWGRAQEQVDPERIVLWGTSFCGGHVLDLAAEDPRIAAVIAQAPMMDGLALAASTTGRNTPRLIADAVRDSWRARRGKSRHCIPVSCPPGGYAMLAMPHVWWAINNIVPEGSTWRNEVAAGVGLALGSHRPVLRAGKVGCPILVQALAGETVVPIRPAEKVAELAPKGEFVLYPGRDHFDIYVGDGFEEVNRDQLRFLRTHLPV